MAWREHPAGCDCGKCAAERALLDRAMGVEPAPQPQLPLEPAAAPPDEGMATLYINGQPFQVKSSHLRMAYEPINAQGAAHDAFIAAIKQLRQALFNPTVTLSVDQFKGQGRMLLWENFPDGKDALVVDLKYGAPAWLWQIPSWVSSGASGYNLKRFVVLIKPSALEAIRKLYEGEDDMIAHIIWSSMVVNNQRP
jgi:hypothetical protein